MRKYLTDFNAFKDGKLMDNDWVIFRYADALLMKAEALLQEEKEEFYEWYEARDTIPRIQALKQTAARDVNVRLTPVYRHVALQGPQKEALEHEVEGAAERMMNHLLFGMRSRLPGPVFSECVDAMESVFNEKS